MLVYEYSTHKSPTRNPQYPLATICYCFSRVNGYGGCGYTVQSGIMFNISKERIAYNTNGKLLTLKMETVRSKRL
jgi:hypothetical protein